MGGCAIIIISNRGRVSVATWAASDCRNPTNSEDLGSLGGSRCSYTSSIWRLVRLGRVKRDRLLDRFDSREEWELANAFQTRTRSLSSCDSLTLTLAYTRSRSAVSLRELMN